MEPSREAAALMVVARSAVEECGSDGARPHGGIYRRIRSGMSSSVPNLECGLRCWIPSTEGYITSGPRSRVRHEADRPIYFIAPPPCRSRRCTSTTCDDASGETVVAAIHFLVQNAFVYREYDRIGRRSGPPPVITYGSMKS